MSPNLDSGMTIKQIAEKDIPDGVPYRIIDVNEIPTDRNAWRATDVSFKDGTGKGPSIDLSPVPESNMMNMLAFLNEMSETEQTKLVELTMKDATAKKWYDRAILTGLVDRSDSKTIDVLRTLQES